MSILIASQNWDMAGWAARFEKLLPGRRIVTLNDAFEPEDITYAVAWKPPAGLFAGLPNLRVIFSLGAGVDHIFSDPALPDLPVVRVVDPDLTARMSEYVVLHCLMHLRQARRYLDQQARRAWEDDRDQPAARDVRVGMMGMGVLGQDAAEKLAMLGFDVAGWSRTARDTAAIPLFHGEVGLTDFLARTDILVVLLPLTEATRGILNLSLFEKLAQGGRLGGPVLINAGRGGLQREADILTALERGVLKAASLDVFEAEPLPETSPLWTHPAVIVTPHNAAMSHPDAIARSIAGQIGRFETGGPLENVVDRGRGY
jgi:glyoxylate/hydroxypyruvate reductase A